MTTERDLGVGDESLGQCEARHWGLGRCHRAPHPAGTGHWIEDQFTPGRGVMFTDAATSQVRVIVCENVNRKEPS